MRIFVINLDSATDRWEHYKDDDRYERWSATHYSELSVNHPIFSKMVSYWNIDPLEHKAKCGAYLSHTNLWRYMVTNKMNDVLILEDDADLVGQIPDSSQLPQDGFTYFGGFTSHKKLTEGALLVDFNEGINQIDHSKYRMLMCLAIYIPTWEVAYKMLQAAEERGRPKAIDTMILHTNRNQYVLYPAPFVERPIPSQIRKKKRKFSNEYYEWINKPCKI
jgi:hypothetical protein